MNKVSVKDFQKNIYEHFKELPIIVTRRGIPYAKIELVNVDTGRDVRRREVDKVHQKVSQIQEQKGVEICKHGMMVGVCKFGCK